MSITYPSKFDKLLDSSYKGRIYPDGTFSVGFDYVRARQKQERHLSKQYEQSCDKSFVPFSAGDSPCTQELLNPYQDLVGVPVAPAEVESAKSEPSRYLNLTKGSVSRKRRKGLSGLTKRGGIAIKQGAFLLQQKYGSRRLSFNTVTIPPLPYYERRLLAQYWGEFTRRFFEEYRRYLRRVSQDSDSIVSVTEIQSKRYKRTGELYLHLHFVCVGVSPNGRYLVHPSWLRSLVKRCVTNLLASLPEYDFDFLLLPVSWSNCCKMEVVKSNASAYLSKYMAKGRVALESVDEYDRGFLPYQWWYVSSALKQAVKFFTVSLDSTICSSFLARLAYYESASQISSIFVGYIQLSYCRLPYLVGCLSPPLASELTCLFLLSSVVL